MKQMPGYYVGQIDPLTKLPLADMSMGAGIEIRWQLGPVQHELLNGATVEGVLRACVQRLERLNSQVPSHYNLDAIRRINSAIGWLEDRTKERAHRGVLGTQEV